MMQFATLLILAVVGAPNRILTGQLGNPIFSELVNRSTLSSTITTNDSVEP